MGDSVPRMAPWLFQVEPYAGESFGHYLGRFRRANVLSSSQLSALLGVGDRVVSYWEVPSRRRIPDPLEKQRLCSVLGLERTRLEAMWLPKAVPLHLPTRLCAVCYGVEPCHQVRWQQAHQSDCEVHHQPLLLGCPQCHHPFQSPHLWEYGQCERCGLSFVEMARVRESVSTRFNIQ